jgi:PAS domain S-box-containing protein
MIQSSSPFTDSTYRQILDAIQDIIFVKDEKSNLVWANRAFVNYFGHSVEQAQKFQKKSHEIPSNGIFRNDDATVVETRQTVEIPEEIAVRFDGVVRKFHTVKSPIFDVDGAVSLIVGLARDISDRIDTDNRLILSDDLLASVLDNSPSVIYAKDPQGKYILVNSRYGKIFGLTRDQIIGKTDQQLFSNEVAAFLRADDIKMLEGGEDLLHEETVQHSDGLHTFISAKFPLRDAQDRIYAVCGISTDITARVEAEKMLEFERARGLFNAKLASLGEMAGSIAHEINTPLATLKTLSSQLAVSILEPEIDRELVKEMSHIIEKTTDRIAIIVKNLRSFSRDGSSDQMTEVSVSKMLSDTLSFCKGKLIENSIQLSVSAVPPNLAFLGREVEISQVIVNLLNNAYDAVKNCENKEVAIEVADVGLNLEITVSDTGHGVPDSIKDKIFQPFHTTKDVGQGTGLGLSISRRIIESHRGTLKLDSSNNLTRFTISIPKKTATEKKTS